MENQFKERYTTAALAEIGKVEVSNDAYAVGEMIQELLFVINKKIK